MSHLLQCSDEWIVLGEDNQYHDEAIALSSWDSSHNLNRNKESEGIQEIARSQAASTRNQIARNRPAQESNIINFFATYFCLLLQYIFQYWHDSNSTVGETVAHTQAYCGGMVVTVRQQFEGGGVLAFGGFLLL